MAEIHVARQPIFGTAGDVAGYELLYKHTATDVAGARAHRRAMAADVVVNAFLSLGLEQLTRGRAAYIDFTREMLVAGVYTLLPPDGVVVELPDDVEPDDSVELACERLVDAGYSLALDGINGATRCTRLLELAAIVKIDVLDQSPARLDAIAEELAPYDVRLLAERVETEEVRALCAGLGYELFQGDYYARPELIGNRALVSDELAIIQAMNVLRDARGSDADAEAVFATDVGLSHKLLRLVNAAARGRWAIESIRHAVQIAGREELGKWLALLLVSSMSGRRFASRELLTLAVHRARHCELLAIPTGRGRDANALFLVGLFSLLDALSGVPMPELLASVACAPAVREALIERTGPYAATLAIAEAYERGEWGTVRRHASVSGIETSEVGALYIQSLAWTRDRVVSLSAG